jgi:hypothetical protein
MVEGGDQTEQIKQVIKYLNSEEVNIILKPKSFLFNRLETRPSI